MNIFLCGCLDVFSKILLSEHLLCAKGSYVLYTCYDLIVKGHGEVELTSRLWFQNGSMQPPPMRTFPFMNEKVTEHHNFLFIFA